MKTLIITKRYVARVLTSQVANRAVETEIFHDRIPRTDL